jgi:fumarate reductase subunit C
VVNGEKKKRRRGRKEKKRKFLKPKKGWWFNLSFFCFHPCGKDSSIIWMLIFFIHLIYVLFSNL